MPQLGMSGGVGERVTGHFALSQTLLGAQSGAPAIQYQKEIEYSNRTIIRDLVLMLA